MQICGISILTADLCSKNIGIRLNKGSPIFYIDVVTRCETDWLYWCSSENITSRLCRVPSGICFSRVKDPSLLSSGRNIGRRNLKKVVGRDREKCMAPEEVCKECFEGVRRYQEIC